MNDHLAALERRGNELEVWHYASRQANGYMAEHGTEELVAELRQARTDKRRTKLGTINVLVLLAHIDRLEAELAKPPLVKL